MLSVSASCEAEPLQNLGLVRAAQGRIAGRAEIPDAPVMRAVTSGMSLKFIE